MGWKQLSGWKKGGIIGGSIGFLYHLVFAGGYWLCNFYFAQQGVGDALECIVPLIFVYPTALVGAMILLPISTNIPDGLQAISMIIIGTVAGLLLGALIGLAFRKSNTGTSQTE